MGAADAIELLINVEQQAARRDRSCLFQIGAEDFVLHFWQQDLNRPFALLARLFRRDAFVAIQHQREHLQQVRLTRTEEPRDPDAISGGVVQVGIDEGTQALAHLPSDHVLIEFDLQMPLVIGLDHPINRAINRLEEELFDGGGSHELLVSK